MADNERPDLPPKEIARVRDEALRRALNTPPTPHKQVTRVKESSNQTKRPRRKEGVGRPPK